MSIYSDAYLPRQGELIDQIGNFDTERMVLFDETRAADALIARNRFRDFSNAYLAIAGKSEAHGFVNEKNETISYVKFSNDRSTAYNIRTYITKDENGAFHLVKTADSPEAKDHIANLSKTAEKLEELYADSRFSINNCTLYDCSKEPCHTGMPESAEFAFLQGTTMEEELDRYLERGEYEKAAEQIGEVLDEIRMEKRCSEFQMTEEFKQVFGIQELPKGLKALEVSDIDLIMPII